MKLQFVLVGTTERLIKNLYNKVAPEDLNKEILGSIKNSIEWHFGKRPIFFINEDNLLDLKNKYPSYYSAAWIVNNQNNKLTELIIVGHRDDISDANKLVLQYAKEINWNKYCKEIEFEKKY